MTHDLKTWPEFYKDVESGVKTFEIRLADRRYAVGDVLHLKEYTGSRYTGREVRVRVTYLTDYKQSGGYVVMAIELDDPSKDFDRDHLERQLELAHARIAHLNYELRVVRNEYIRYGLEIMNDPGELVRLRGIVETGAVACNEVMQDRCREEVYGRPTRRSTAMQQLQAATGGDRQAGEDRPGEAKPDTGPGAGGESPEGATDGESK